MAYLQLMTFHPRLQQLIALKINLYPHLIKHDRTVDHLRRVVDNENLSQFEGFSVVHDSWSQDEDCVEVAHHHEQCGEGTRHQRPAACPGICKF